MKIKITISFLMMLTIINCTAQNESEELKISNMLISFYNAYITAVSQMPPDLKSIDNLREHYCTNKLIDELSDENLDYDPFLNAQDIDLNALKLINVKKISGNEKKYKVSYPSMDSRIIEINLSIVKDGDTYKIDSIIH